MRTEGGGEDHLVTMCGVGEGEDVLDPTHLKRAHAETLKAVHYYWLIREMRIFTFGRLYICAISCKIDVKSNI